jgi:hypothetical protein
MQQGAYGSGGTPGTQLAQETGISLAGGSDTYQLEMKTTAGATPTITVTLSQNGATVGSVTATGSVQGSAYANPNVPDTQGEVGFFGGSSHYGSNVYGITATSFSVNAPSGPPTAAWTNGNSTNTWNDAGNWAPAGILSAQAAVANFTTVGAGTLTVDVAQTVGTINITSPVSYTINGNGGSITIDDTGDAIVNPAVNVTAGSHAINAPIVLANGVSFNLSSGTGLTIGGAITGSGPVSVNGGGTLTIATTGVLPSGSALSINTGATVALAAGPAPLSAPIVQTVASLSFDANPLSKLDIANNEVTVTGTNETAIRADIVAGNIFTSMGSSVYGIGENVSGSGTVIRYTVNGDANLDGTVNFSDLLTLAANYGLTTADWAQGDFNYDNTVNFSDLLTLAANYGSSLSPSAAESNGISPSFAAQWNLAVSEVSSVPEPTSIGLLAIGATGLLARRRRAVAK